MLIYIIHCYFGSGHMEIILTESVKMTQFVAKLRASIVVHWLSSR